jgi:hypothetical protein
MAITLTIDGEDLTGLMLVETLQISDRLNERNTCSFDLREPSGASLLVDDAGAYLVTDGGDYIGTGVRPVVGSIVTVQDGATVVFAGTVDGISQETLDRREALRIAVDCVDYNQLADRRLVAEAFVTPGQTLGDIVRALVATYLTEFSVADTYVEDGPIVDRAIFNYQTVSEAFQELAELTGYAWFIDYDKALHYFARETNAAPYSLTETSANWGNLTVTRDRTSYRNRQFVRAGTDQTDALTEELVGDGTRKVFTLGFPAATEPTITVGGVGKTVGIGGLESGTDWYWNKGATEVKQDDAAAAVADGVTIAVTYTGMQPIMLAAQDDAEVSLRGVWEAIEDRPNIDRADLARSVGEGLLRKQARIPVTISWETRVSGLAAGQLISVENNLHDLSGTYLITSVEYADRSGLDFTYRVTAVDGEAGGGWVEFFRGLALYGRKFTIRENEILLVMRQLAETVTLTDSVSYTTAATASSKWVVGTSLLGFFEI